MSLYICKGKTFFLQSQRKFFLSLRDGLTVIHKKQIMDTTRLHKVERLIQKDLGEIFLAQTKQMHGVLVSVTNVRMSPDLSLSKAYLSIFPSEKGKEILSNINSQKKSVRYELGLRIGKQVRRVPELAFFLDDSLDYLDKIDHLLNHDKEENEH
jgi:ribosome-binding factor A